jgi:hypothetical protein
VNDRAQRQERANKKPYRAALTAITPMSSKVADIDELAWLAEGKEESGGDWVFTAPLVRPRVNLTEIPPKEGFGIVYTRPSGTQYFPDDQSLVVQPGSSCK